MRKYLFFIFLLLKPEVGYVSGNEQAGFVSEMYSLHLSGGISSWDYERIDRNSLKLTQALDKMKPKLDNIFQKNISNLGLPVIKYDTGEPAPDYIDGVLIENDPEKKSRNKHHFLSYFNNRETKIASAGDSRAIPGTSFNLGIQILVTDRLKRDHIQLLLMEMIESIQENEDLGQLLY